MTKQQNTKIKGLMEQWDLVRERVLDAYFLIHPYLEKPGTPPPVGEELIRLQKQERRAQRQESFIIKELIAALEEAFPPKKEIHLVPFRDYVVRNVS